MFPHMIRARSPVASALAALLLGACTDPEQRAQEKQRALETARASRKAEQEKKQGPAVEKVKLDPFWDDSSYLKVVSEGACPEGIWALFPGQAPGEDEAAKKANEGRRNELAARFREAKLLLRLRAPEVALSEFDAPRGSFPLQLPGSLDCSDSSGRLTIAWAPAKAITPPSSAAKQGAEVQQNLWVAEPLSFQLPMRTMAEAQEFKDKHRFDLTARLVLKLGRTEVDKKMFRTAKVTQGELSIGGGLEDWGAGRLVRAELLGLRLAKDFEQTPLIVLDKRAGK